MSFAGQVQQRDAQQYRQDSLTRKHEHSDPRQEHDNPKRILHRQAEPTERRMMILHPSAGMAFIEEMGRESDEDQWDDDRDHDPADDRENKQAP
jgi:hypothetical protein